MFDGCVVNGLAAEGGANRALVVRALNTLQMEPLHKFWICNVLEFFGAMRL